MRSCNPHHRIKRARGLTLVEILVAVSIFSIAAILITGSFVAINAARRDAREKEDILNQLRFTLDLIGHEILSGSAFPDPNDTCLDGVTLVKNGCPHILFASKVRPEVPLKRLEYCFNSESGLADGCPGPEIGVLKRAEQKSFGACQNLSGTLASECFLPFTSSKAVLNQAKFFVDHRADDLQPIVTISLDGTVGDEAFRISASYSPRLLQDPSARPPSDTTAPVVVITNPVPGNSTSQASPHSIGSVTSVSLAGTATDINTITEVRWRNRTNGQSAKVSITPGTSINWVTVPITIIPNVANEVTVEATDEDGNPSIPATIWLSTTASLGKPTVTADGFCNLLGVQGIRLLWSAVPGASEYHIHRCTDAGCDPVSAPQLIPSPRGSPYFDTNVTMGTIYRYVIRAHNHVANPPVLGPPSDIVQATPISCTKRYLECASSTCRLTDCPGSPQVCPAHQCSSLGASCGVTSQAGVFTVTANPQFVRAGVSGSVTTKKTSTLTTITFTVTSGTFTQNVVLSASGGPPGTEPRFIANPNITCASSSCTSSTPHTRQFLVEIPDNTPIGSYDLTVTASGGGKRASIPLVLDVFPVGGGQL